MSDQDPKLWKTSKLVAFLEKAALAYRDGSPIIDDDTYDHFYLVELKRRDPIHPYLKKIEIEIKLDDTRLKHPEPMLSLEKSYSVGETDKWITRVLKEAKKIGIDESEVKVIATAKLDGLAAMRRHDGLLATRGDGIHGNDITSAFDKGVVDVGKGIVGVGELVMEIEYFETHLKSLGYSHPRNICVGVVNSDELNRDFIQALKNGVIRFIPYSTLKRWEGSFTELIEQHNEIQKLITEYCPYPTDGIVVEITHQDLKKTLGSTTHHNRWQIAIKQRSRTKEATVKSIKWQTKRTGRVTPVLEINSIELSGAMVSRVTAHHAGNVKKLKLGKGAIILVERSGEVIPKIVKVLKSANKTIIIDKCNSCAHELSWHRDFLICTNHTRCPAQIENALEHFFKTHGQVDGFGSMSIKKLVATGIDTLEKIYNSSEDDFIKAGFGAGQAKNLRRELKRSLEVEIEDWRFLAAFGISHLGKGDSKHLLQNIQINELSKVSIEDIMKIEGFAEITSAGIVAGLNEKWPSIKQIKNLGFKLSKTTLLLDEQSTTSPVTELKLVFTGRMLQKSRDQMIKNAQELGAIVQSSVSSKTDILIYGEKAGSAKIESAKKFDTLVMSEDEYMTFLEKS